jgi:copper chaperone CopZ
MEREIMKTVEYDVLGMHCVSCSMGIQKLLKKTKGVTEVEVHLTDSKVHVTFDESSVNDQIIINQVARLGYKAVQAKK